MITALHHNRLSNGIQVLLRSEQALLQVTTGKVWLPNLNAPKVLTQTIRPPSKQTLTLTCTFTNASEFNPATISVSTPYPDRCSWFVMVNTGTVLADCHSHTV